MNVIELATTTSPDLITQLGKLYQLVSPNYAGTAQEFGEGMQSAALEHHEAREIHNLQSEVPPRYLLAVDDDTLLGYGLVQSHIGESGDYSKSCYAFIFVHPDHRRKGVGVALLTRMLHELAHSKLDSIFFFSEDQPCTDFLTAHGGEITEQSVMMELELDHDTQLPMRDSGDEVEITIIENPSEDQLDQFMEVYNRAKEDEPRSNDARYHAMTSTDWLNVATKYAENLLVGTLAIGSKIVAVSDLMQTGVTSSLQQRFTGTLPEYRGRGYATMLKAEILYWITQNWTEFLPIKVQTSTLLENRGMQEVNHKLGYNKTGEELTIEFFRDPTR